MRDAQYRAKLTRPSKNNPRNYDGEKALVERLRVVVYLKGEIHEAVDARLWFPHRGDGMAALHCTVWCRPAPGSKVHEETGGEWRTARGSASGCGYHKCSAALAEALTAAGFDFEVRRETRDGEMKVLEGWRDWHFGGTGSRAMEDAVLAAARAMGWRGVMRVLS